MESTVLNSLQVFDRRGGGGAYGARPSAMRPGSDRSQSITDVVGRLGLKSICGWRKVDGVIVYTSSRHEEPEHSSMNLVCALRPAQTFRHTNFLIPVFRF